MIISVCLLCYYKGMCCFKRAEQQRIHDQEERKKRRLRLVELKLSNVSVEKIKAGETCGICFDVFGQSAQAATVGPEEEESEDGNESVKKGSLKPK